MGEAREEGRVRKVEMRKERVVGWWGSDLEMGAWDVEDERMDVFVEELQFASV